MLRVVLDPTIMLRGLLNHYCTCTRLLFDYSDRYRAIFSDQTLQVTRLLLLHPLLVAAFPRLAVLSQSRLSAVFLAAERVALPADYTDDVFVATARAARVDYLVSEDPFHLGNSASFDLQIMDSSGFIALLDSEFVPAYAVGGP